MADNGRIMVLNHIERADCRDQPDRLFVFGDNCQRKGRGGQAAAMRGEPNAVGIVTKHAPHNGPEAFFAPEDFYDVMPAIDAGFERIKRQLDAGRDVVWPADGVGTGRARLQQTAPRIAEAVEYRRAIVFEIACQAIDADRSADAGGN